MNQQDIIRMAREAGMPPVEIISDKPVLYPALTAIERFAEAAYAAGAAAERQNICKQIAMLHDSLALASDPGGLKTRGSKT